MTKAASKCINREKAAGLLVRGCAVRYSEYLGQPPHRRFSYKGVGREWGAEDYKPPAVSAEPAE